MKTKTEKKINLLIAYAFVSTLFIGFLVLTSFNKKDKAEKLMN